MSTVLISSAVLIIGVGTALITIIVPLLAHLNIPFLLLLFLVFHSADRFVLPSAAWVLVSIVSFPFLPWPLTVAAALVITVLFRYTLRHYIEHTHIISFLTLIIVSAVVWGLLLSILTALWAYVLDIPSPMLSPNVVLVAIFVDAILASVLTFAIAAIESRFYHCSIKAIFQRYYEQALRPHFRAAVSSHRDGH